MKTKVSEATNIQLNWMVAKCKHPDIKASALLANVMANQFNPTTDWARGGPIIEREEISVEREFSTRDNWAAWTPAPIRDESEAFGYGPTPLIAAMRCYVTSQLGDEVEIPEELK